MLILLYHTPARWGHVAPDLGRAAAAIPACGARPALVRVGAAFGDGGTAGRAGRMLRSSLRDTGPGRRSLENGTKSGTLWITIFPFQNVTSERGRTWSFSSAFQLFMAGLKSATGVCQEVFRVSLPDSFGVVPRLAPARAHPPLTQPRATTFPRDTAPRQTMARCMEDQGRGCATCSGTGWRCWAVGPLRAMPLK